MNRDARVGALTKRVLCGALAAAVIGTVLLQAGFARAESPEPEPTPSAANSPVPQSARVQVDVKVNDAGLDASNAHSLVEYRLDGDRWIEAKDSDDRTPELEFEVPQGVRVELRASADPVKGGTWEPAKIDPEKFTPKPGEVVEVEVKLTLEPDEKPTPSADPDQTPKTTPAPDPTPTADAEPTTEPSPTIEPESSPSAEPAVEPTTKPTAGPSDQPTGEPTAQPTAKPSGEPTSESTDEAPANPTAEPSPVTPSRPAAGPAVQGQGGATIGPQDAGELDASNGDVTVSVTQYGGAADGSRTAEAGTEFIYTVKVACAVLLGGDCLTGGRVTIDLSQWKEYTFTPAGTSADVSAVNWDPATGLLTLSLADIGAAAISLNWDFSFQSPGAISASAPRDLTVQATVTAIDFEPVTSTAIQSHITTVQPAPQLHKTSQKSLVFVDSAEAANNLATWNISNSFAKSTGIELPTGLTVTDTIPAGFTYQSCTADSSYGWSSCSYDGVSTVTWVWDGTWTGATSYRPVGTVTAKAPTTGAGTQHTNNAQIKATWADNSSQTAAASADVWLISDQDYKGLVFDKAVSQRGTWYRKSSPAPVSVGKWFDAWWGGRWAVDNDLYWLVGLSGGVKRTGTTIIEAEVSDDLPCLDDSDGPMYTSKLNGVCQRPAFNLTWVEVSSDYQPTSAWRPKATLTDGREVDLDFSRTNPDNGHMEYRVPTDLIGQVARITAPRQAGDGFRFDDSSTYLFLHGYVPDNIGLKPGDMLHNVEPTARLWYAGQAEIDPFQVATGPDAMIEVRGAVESMKKETCGGTLPQVRWCIQANLRSTSSGHLLDGDTVISDLWPAEVPIPSELTAVGARTTWVDQNTGWGVDESDGLSGFAPTVTLNYTATQHLIQWRIPAASLERYRQRYLGAWGDPTFLSTIALRADLPVVDLPGPGIYTNTAAVQMSELDNPDAAFDFGNREADVMDLDNNPATGFLVSASSTVRLDPAPNTEGFGIAKAVKGDLDKAFKASPSVGSVTPGATGRATYRLTWTNRNATNLNNSVMYDLLPMIGDHGALSTNVGTARGSEFGVAFQSVGTMPAGVTVEYSTADNPCRDEIFPGNAGCVDDWSTSVPNPVSNVKALRWKHPAALGFGESWSVEFTVGVPAGIRLDQTAWNSVAANARRVDTSLLQQIEAPRVGVRAGWVGDATWTKTDTAGTPRGGSAWQLTAVDAGGAPLTGGAAYSQSVSDCLATPCSGLDTDPAAGKFRVKNLAEDTRYRIVETTPATGYLLDSTPHYADSARVADWTFGAITNERAYSLTLTKRVKIDGAVLNPADTNPVNDVPFTVRYRLLPPSPTPPEAWVEKQIENGESFSVTGIVPGWGIEIFEPTTGQWPTVYWNTPNLTDAGSSLPHDVSGGWSPPLDGDEDLVLTNNAKSITPVDLPFAGSTTNPDVWTFGILTGVTFASGAVVVVRRSRRELSTVRPGRTPRR